MIETQFTQGILRTIDHHRISYDHYQIGHQKAVVIAHGFFNSKQATLLKDLAKELTEEYDVLLLDFRGHGQSSGQFSWTAKESSDLETLLNYTHKFYLRIGVIGFSLGASISIITAARTPLIHSLIAVSCPVAFAKIEYCFWQLDMENDILYNTLGDGKQGKGVRPGPFWLKKPNPIDLVDKLTIPVFYIHGEKDWLIKPWHSEALYQKTQSAKRLAILKNGPHAEYLIRKNKNREEMLTLIKEWFRETL